MHNKKLANARTGFFRTDPVQRAAAHFCGRSIARRQERRRKPTTVKAFWPTDSMRG
jgi:hypothetical protein